jgi:RimJ/RimL family protein N-acetyltransferase
LFGVTLRAAFFDGEYDELGAWTGESREELEAQEEYHSGERQVWLAWDGPRVVGVMKPWLRPDGRRTLYFGPCRPSAYPVLVAHLSGECYTTVDGADGAALESLAALGFRTSRTELRYSIPVTRFDAPVPAGLSIVSAAQTELEPLMYLDCALREDVPGASGWQPDPQWFREETYDSPFFDPDAYLVAVSSGRYVGLVRIWNGPRPQPRLGMIGVLLEYRRQGLAKALIGQAFAALHSRGVVSVIAEADAGNSASNGLLTGLGGVVTGKDVELRRVVGVGG